jgi:enamine deaminase RidA (YjgF/YER057c/UK114 family)
MKFCRFVWVIIVLSLSAFGQSNSAQYINPPNVPHPPGYTHAVIVPANKLVFLAGQVAINSHGDLVGKDDFRAQASQAFENIKAVLAAAGTTPDHLVRLNYYLVGLDDDKLKVLREVRDRYVNTKEPPASTLIAVVHLARPEFQIEIEAVATMP